MKKFPSDFWDNPNICLIFGLCVYGMEVCACSVFVRNVNFSTSYVWDFLCMCMDAWARYRVSKKGQHIDFIKLSKNPHYQRLERFPWHRSLSIYQWTAGVQKDKLQHSKTSKLSPLESNSEILLLPFFETPYMGKITCAALLAMACSAGADHSSFVVHNLILTHTHTL